MGRTLKGKILCSFLIGLILVSGAVGQIAWAEEDEEVQQQLTELKNTVDELKEEIPKIGYINRQEAFSVFPQAVKEERQEVNKIEKEMDELSAKAEKEEIDESKFKKERDLLRAKHLQARINVDLAILNTMIEAKGFSEINEKLQDLRKQAKPMRGEIVDLIKAINNYTVSPQQVSETLDKIGNQQFKQLNDILTNLAQLKITQVAQRIAREEDYNLVIEQQNVILYREKELITDLTPDVKEKLKKELKPE